MGEIVFSLHKYHSNEWKISHVPEYNFVGHHHSIQSVREQIPYVCPTVMLMKGQHEKAYKHYPLPTPCYLTLPKVASTSYKNMTRKSLLTSTDFAYLDKPSLAMMPFHTALLFQSSFSGSMFYHHTLTPNSLNVSPYVFISRLK